ncbi:hypothetical protein [Phenylobacterium sp.]|uniref:hypothetical protein n=1 Tax=Phenylobacterium sp. TaxID=1871053 RepID=UPI0035669144
MQLSALPIGPVYYQPVTPVPPVARVPGRAGEVDGDGDDGGQKLRAAPPPGLGAQLDIEA